MSPSGEESRWLLLIHQLPKEPAYLRVKVGRKLARLGAVALKNSVYALPRTESTIEDFQWVRRMIVEGGGEATVVEAELLEGLTDLDVRAKFIEAKDAEYAELARETRALLPSRKKRKARALSDEDRAALLGQLSRLEQRLDEASSTDFFSAPGREAVTALLREHRQELESPSCTTSPEPSPRRPKQATWVTRTGIHVDRIASAWLIRRFIDSEANFKFVPARGYRPAPGELRFDMFEAEYSHEGDGCTFETLIARFELQSPGLRGLAEVVHDIDIKDGKFRRPETPGVAACIAGLCQTAESDEERLRRGCETFDALLAHFSRSMAP